MSVTAAEAAGRDEFAARMQQAVAGKADLSEIPRAQRRPTRSLAAIAHEATDTHEAIGTAYARGAWDPTDPGLFTRNGIWTV